MKKRYDFSDGVRGKFHRPRADAQLPVYLDRDVQRFLDGRARAIGVDVAKLVNEMLKRDIALLQSLEARNS